MNGKWTFLNLDKQQVHHTNVEWRRTSHLQAFQDGKFDLLCSSLVLPTGVYRTSKPRVSCRKLDRRHRRLRLEVFGATHATDWHRDETHDMEMDVDSCDAVHALPPMFRPPSLGQLQQLPLEILAMIFDQIEDTLTVVCFSLSHSVLFQLGYGSMCSRYLRAHTWAGDRLVYLDLNSPLEVLPVGSVLADSELRNYTNAAIARLPGTIQAAVSAMSVDTSYSQDALGDPLVYVLHNLGIPSFPTATGSKLFSDAFWTNVEKMGLIHDRPLAEQKKLLELLDIEDNLEVRYDHDEHSNWVLCNLTMGTYVREDHFVTFGTRVQKQDVEGQPSAAGRLIFSFLLEHYTACIGESVYDDLATHTVFHSHRGCWAGHRFAFTTFQRLPPLGQGREWKDVTDEVGAFLLEHPLDTRYV
ncbi:hypothetical protein EIP91_010161 [Steccherinum ochraceum]|uniref:Uncharacterized protein n=1 Tax=Steccherinum ochraceum TaxID=92696 RepID=A0A4R0RX03_9APHY|nr:hypothetical protein EIP91_010161 [Steccherinum ochraceum]